MEREGAPGGRCGASAGISPGPFDLKLEADFELRGTEKSRSQGYGGQIFYSHGDWREGLAGDLSLEKKELSGWSGET